MSVVEPTQYDVDPVTGSEEVRRTLWFSHRLEEINNPDYSENENTRVPVTNLDDANLVGSEIFQDDSNDETMHAVTLDIDFPCKLVESSTDGNYHLYIDVPISWSEYERIIDAFADAGIVEDGYRTASIKRKQTFLRPPGVKKRWPRL